MPWNAPICLPPPPSCAYDDDEDSSHISATLIFGKKEMKQYLQWQSDEQGVHHARKGLGRLPTAQQYGEFQHWRKQRKLRHDEEDDFRGRAFSSAWALSSDLSEHLTASRTKEESSRRVREDSAFSDGSDSERERQDTRIRTAATCKHVLHPANASGAADELDFCPCCTVSHHVRYMALLTKAVNETDDSKSPDELSPERDRQTDRQTDHADALYAYFAGKMETLRIIELLQKVANIEDLWSAQNPDFEYDSTSPGEDASKTIMSASRAVSMYWESLMPSVTTTDVAADAARQGPPSAATQAIGRKHVTFTADTDFERRSRPECYFKRGTARYQAGRWALEPDSDDEKTLKTLEDEHDIKQSYFINDYDMEEDVIPDDETAEFGGSQWALLVKTFNLQLSQQDQSSDTVEETPKSSTKSSVDNVSLQSSTTSFEVDGEVAEAGITDASKREAGDDIPAANGPVERSVPGDIFLNHAAVDDHAVDTEEEGELSDFDEHEEQDEVDLDDDGDSDWETEDSGLDDDDENDDDIDGEGDYIVFEY